MAEVVLDGVTKRFPPDVVAVSGVTLDVPDGELLVLVGPSGCGKSTTLRMVAGLEDPSEGRILIDGRVVNDVAPRDRDIAMVFQNYALYPHMSVFANMAFGLKVRGVPKEERRRAVWRAATTLGIVDLLDRKPKALSGGEKQRVALGRAIVRDPRVFLFDEPLSNLDARMRVEMRTEIKKLHQRLRTTMIYVTHDQTEAMTLGDRIVVMRDGVVQQMGPPLEIYERPANVFVATFIGTPSINLIEGTIVGGKGRLRFREGALDLPLPDRLQRALEGGAPPSVVLGVRSEHVGRAVPGSEASGCQVRMTVDLVETLGDHLLVHAERDGMRLVARLAPSERLAAGESIVMRLDPEQVLLFDGEGGRSLEA